MKCVGSSVNSSHLPSCQVFVVDISPQKTSSTKFVSPQRTGIGSLCFASIPLISEHPIVLAADCNQAFVGKSKNGALISLEMFIKDLAKYKASESRFSSSSLCLRFLGRAHEYLPLHHTGKTDQYLPLYSRNFVTREVCGFSDLERRRHQRAQLALPRNSSRQSSHGRHECTYNNFRDDFGEARCAANRDLRERHLFSRCFR